MKIIFQSDAFFVSWEGTVDCKRQQSFTERHNRRIFAAYCVTCNYCVALSSWQCKLQAPEKIDRADPDINHRR